MHDLSMLAVLVGGALYILLGLYDITEYLYKRIKA